MRDNVWIKMKKTLIILSIGLAIASLYLVLKEKPKKNETIDEKKDLVISMPEPDNYGIIRILDETGEVAYTYAGYFKIDNDGKDGKSISMSLVIPDGGYLDGSETLPERVKLYDRSNEEIVYYVCSPEIKDDTLHLYDASIIDNEDVSNLTE